MSDEQAKATAGPLGVVVFLRKTENGTVLLVMDDVRGRSTTQWEKEVFYTEREFQEREVRELTLDEEELAKIGFAVMSRLAVRLG